MLLDFDVTETDPIFSDGHALLSWLVKITNITNVAPSRNPDFTHRKWNNKRVSEFQNNFSQSEINELFTNLQPNKTSINQVVLKVDQLVTCSLFFPMKSPYDDTSRGKSWFGPRCRDARKKYHRVRKKFHRCRNNYNKSLLKQSSRAYRRIMNLYIRKLKDANAKKSSETSIQPNRKITGVT